VWHVSTLDWQRDGRLQLLGIVQEQHPERARLFMQWKQMNWPVLADPFNLLGVSAVPVTLLIDEMGIVRKVNPGLDEVAAFVKASGPIPRPIPMSDGIPDTNSLLVGEPAPREAALLALWGSPEEQDRAIAAMDEMLDRFPDDGVLHFYAGVAHRRRHDSPAQRPGDFPAAARYWTQALERNPNQYIWRRRLQQYGPRLDKPYAFYDWVPQARREIEKRGGTPVDLKVEPTGAEYASPDGTSEADVRSLVEPDPVGRITRDLVGLVRAEVTVVPTVVRPGQSVRVHVAFRPNAGLKAHWNNEAAGLVYQVNVPSGWVADPPLQELPQPEIAVSTETRLLEFELRAPDQAVGTLTFSTYAVYYVCEDKGGNCVYRRLDVPVTLSVRP